MTDRVCVSSVLPAAGRGDATKADCSQATVLALYLSERGNRQLVQALGPSLQPGTRVVSFFFTVEGWERWVAHQGMGTHGRALLCMGTVGGSSAHVRCGCNCCSLGCNCCSPGM